MLATNTVPLAQHIQGAVTRHFFFVSSYHFSAAACVLSEASVSFHLAIKKVYLPSFVNWPCRNIGEERYLHNTIYCISTIIINLIKYSY